MNKCLRCSALLSETEQQCTVCGLTVSQEFAETLQQNIEHEIENSTEPTIDVKRWQKIKALFETALELEPKNRATFLKSSCGDDINLRNEVEKLLASFDNAESFLEEPVVRKVASVFGEKKTLIGQNTTGEIRNGNFVAGTILASRYRIIGLLGRGGMGEVYKAEDIKLSQTVALKFLPDNFEDDRAALGRFHSEVRIARQVAHPNVCRVFDIGEIDGRHFLSMEFIDGDDLSSLLRRVGRLASERAIEIARQLCIGLSAIHNTGILHRDFKPANVIIDSKGKARITDFGIAGFEEEISKEELRAGTPAYMSPEQIMGKDVSARSDIYSLGLVLYEIFTGKQAFTGNSIPELIRKQQSETPTNPSDHVKGIDPLVEQVIFQCLEKNPMNRPPSALHVALALPGGNPLQVALEAGDTPSPEMVAAAPKKGALNPPIAVACLSAVIGLLAFLIFFSGKIKYHEWIPLEKSTEILAERSKSILKNLGYTDTAVDTDYGFDESENYYNYARRMDDSPNRWERMRTGQPAVIYFWYRQSPRYLEPLEDVYVTPSDPPNVVSGMKEIFLDTKGRLIEFHSVPSQVEETLTEKAQTDWTTLFTEAGLDIKNYRQTESKWTPPMIADERMAWEGNHVDHAEMPVRIEAASYRGKTVYFQVIAPWDKPARQEETFASTAVKTAGVILTLLFFSVLIGGIFLARYNLKQGRSDNRGAFKIALFVFIVSVLGNLLIANHIPALVGELKLFFKTAGDSLFVAALVWLIYIALEPFARRRWSNLIISWNRLLAGDFRDPMVGRDILVGGILGLCHTFSIYLMFSLPVLMNKPIEPNKGGAVIVIQSLNNLLGNSLLSLSNGIFYGLGLLFLLSMLVIILRKERFAIAALWLMNFLVLQLAFASAGPWIYLIGSILIASITVLCTARLGLLAAISFFIFFTLSFHNPITADVSRFYFGNTVFASVVLLGLATYGFYTSLAGQTIFQKRLLQEE